MSEQAKTPFEQWFETTKSAAVWHLASGVTSMQPKKVLMQDMRSGGVAAVPFQSRVQP